jgi:predicted CoA-binding protein
MQITEEAAHAIIAGIGAADNATEQMLEIVELLDQAGYKIVPKDESE